MIIIQHKNLKKGNREKRKKLRTRRFIESRIKNKIDLSKFTLVGFSVGFCCKPIIEQEKWEEIVKRYGKHLFNRCGKCFYLIEDMYSFINSTNWKCRDTQLNLVIEIRK